MPYSSASRSPSPRFSITSYTIPANPKPSRNLNPSGLAQTLTLSLMLTLMLTLTIPLTVTLTLTLTLTPRYLSLDLDEVPLP